MVELLEIEAAVQRLSGLVKRTPVSHDLALSQRASASAPPTPRARSASKAVRSPVPLKRAGRSTPFYRCPKSKNRQVW